MRLRPCTADDTPAWSPSGSTIAFTRTYSTRTSETVGLYLAQEGHPLRLLKVNGHAASWSPDSRRLAFDDGRRIGIINADGSGLRYLTHPKGRDVDPAWSPDGRTIAFVRYASAQPRHGVRPNIWLMNTHGGNQRLFIKNGAHPAWKPR